MEKIVVLYILPSKVLKTFPYATSKILIIPSMAPLAIYFPSGL